MNDLIKASKTCSPEQLAKLKKHYIDHSAKLFELSQLPQTKSTKAAVRKIEQTLSKIRPLIPLGTQEAGASSVRVQAPGLEGEQGDTVDVDQKTYAVSMLDGTKRHVTVNVTDKEGNQLSPDAIRKEVRNQAQQIAKFESEVGITRTPSKRKEVLRWGGSPRQGGPPARPELTEEGKKKAAKAGERRDKKEEEKQKFIDGSKKSGKDGALYLGDNKWVVSLDGETHEVPGKRGASEKDVIAATRENLKTKADETKEPEEVKPAQKKKTEAKPKQVVRKPITSKADLPDHTKDEKLRAIGHTLTYGKYSAAVKKFYEDRGATAEKIEATRDRALTKLRIRRNNGSITEGAYKRRTADVNRQSQEVLDALDGRIGDDGSLTRDHANLVRDAAKDPDKLAEIHRTNLKSGAYFPGKKQEDEKSLRSAKIEDLVESLALPDKKRDVSQSVKTSLSPLRQALGLPTKYKYGASKKVLKDFEAAGVTSAPKDIEEGESSFQILEGREAKSTPKVSARQGEKERNAFKRDLQKQGYDKRSDEYKALVSDFENQQLEELYGRGQQRGETTAEARNKKQLMDWASGVKNNVRRYLDSSIKSHDIDSIADSKKKQRLLREIQDEFQDIMQGLAGNLSDKWEPNPVFDTLSENSKAEILDKLTNIKKSVIGNLTDNGAASMAGLFLPSTLFKALNLSEKHKIEKYKNSFGQGTSGVNPVTMNSELFEKDKEEKDDDKVKKSLNLGFYVGV